MQQSGENRHMDFLSVEVKQGCIYLNWKYNQQIKELLLPSLHLIKGERREKKAENRARQNWNKRHLSPDALNPSVVLVTKASF